MDFKMNLKGVCTKTVEFNMDDNFYVSNVTFKGGCPGNTIGVAHLAEGRHADEIINLLSGVRCESRKTSCPDQFSKALLTAKEKILSGIPL